MRGDITGETWLGTGRVTRVALQGMSIREQTGNVGGSAFWDRFAEGGPIDVPASPPDLRSYVELALRGGFPGAMDRAPDMRDRWLRSYVDQLVTRDAAALGGLRDPARLRWYLDAYALNSAGLVTEATPLRASRLDRKTALGYERLLTDCSSSIPSPRGHPIACSALSTVRNATSSMPR